MAGHPRRTHRTSTRAGGLAVALSFVIVVSGCSWKTLDESSTGEMRPVPTVPPTPAPGEEVAVVPQNPAGPVTTDVVGDPRPDPDSDVELPPLPETPVVDACIRLVDVQVAEKFAAAEQFAVALDGGVATTESVTDDACRFTAGSGVAEVHYLAQDEVESDWFRRDEIEPVGDVIADAVGIAVFVAPGSDSATGYTIALVSRRQGAVIAVRGTPDDRSVAVELANLVESST